MSFLICHFAIFLLMTAVWAKNMGSPVGADPSAVPPLQKLSRAQLEFALDLYKMLANGSGSMESENLAFSPYSVTSLLSMLYLGSSGTTSEQLRHVLHFDNLSYVEVHRSYKKIVEGIKYGGAVGKSGGNLTLANKIFLQKDVGVSRIYQEKLFEYYDAALEKVDFMSNSSFAKDLINMWVKIHTRGKINTLLDAPPSPDTKVLLANAIYFKGFWLYKFDRKKTYERSTFRVSSTESTVIPMMVAKMKVPHGYSDALKCSILELPYMDKRLSMFVLLPDDGLADIEAGLTSDVIGQLFSSLKDDTVNVRIPRFKLKSNLWLREPLIRLGLDDLFAQGKADLSGLTSGTSDIFVSDVTHRSTISVNEEGSEAAAASTLDVERIGDFGEFYFEVDHPFIFFIWDYQINMVIFIGRVKRPLDDLEPH